MDAARLTWTIILALGLAGCLAGGRGTEGAPAVSVRILRGAEMVPGESAFDPGLPGYHLIGGIGAVRLTPLREGPVRAFALALKTSPGMQPNLEGFSLAVGDTIYQTSPFGPEHLLEVLLRRPDGSARIVSRVGLEEYFLFSTAGAEVIVRFAPRALELLQRPCVLSWVDWYRR